LVGAGGFIGAILRFAASGAIPHGAFPFATLAVNVAGSFGLGVTAGLLERGVLGDAHRHIVAVGLLGSLTTFSTFSFETLRLLERNAYGPALLSVFMNVSLALLAAWIGLRIAS